MRKQVLIWAGVLILAFISGSALASEKDGLVTVESKNSVPVTIQEFEDAIRANADQGWMVFTQLDHAAAAEKNGLKLLPRTVIVYGNPRAGTGNMVKVPTVAIDIPPKALVWQDDQGKVWLSYNSAAYLADYVYARHGVPRPPAEIVEGYAKLLQGWTEKATQ
jgi:uncharacterized protein (DUF302 family)